MTPTLHTLTTVARYHQDIRKSRFLAQAAPVDTPQQALAFVQQVSDAGATHNCWAYRIGQDYRFNDDGEPGGTAGRPMLQAIEGQGMDRVAIVVSRWYGGIKLGAGGLARAYGGSASECLRIAPRIPIVRMARLGLRCELADLALLSARLRDFGVVIEQETFEISSVTLHLRVPAAVEADVKARIVDLSRGRSEAYNLD